MNVKNIFLMNQKVLLLDRQLAEKNLLEEGRLIHYPGLFKLKPHCRKSLLLFSLVECFIQESKGRSTNKRPSSFL